MIVSEQVSSVLPRNRGWYGMCLNKLVPTVLLPTEYSFKVLSVILPNASLFGSYTPVICNAEPFADTIL